MIPPFDRRDSGIFTGAACLLVFLLILAITTQALGWGWRGLPVAAASAVASALVLAALLRRLPPDVPFRPLSDAAAAAARTAPPPDRCRLRIALQAEPLGWYRLDICLDGVRVGQLRPGTMFVTDMQPGAHSVTARAWLRTLRTRELINALPGTDTDLVFRGTGDRSRQYGVDRHGMAAVLADRRTVLIEPSERQGP